MTNPELDAAIERVSTFPDQIARLTQERDEARAEVERLWAALANKTEDYERMWSALQAEVEVGTRVRGQLRAALRDIIMGEDDTTPAWIGKRARQALAMTTYAELVQRISVLCRCARHWPRGRHAKGLGPCLVKNCQCPYGKPEPK